MEFDAMRVFNAKWIVMLPALLAVLVLSGCGHTSGLEIANDVGKSVLFGMAAGEVADCKDYRQPNNRSICEEQTEAVIKLGKSLHRELKPADDSPSAEDLSNELGTFIEQRRTPAVGSSDDTDEVSSP